MTITKRATTARANLEATMRHVRAINKKLALLIARVRVLERKRS